MTALSRRLQPLRIAIFLQAFALWVPIEKLFMTELGFDATAIGLTAAAYAAVVPLLELPAGLLSDRWSRRGVLMLASLASGGSALVCGLSHDVATYVVGTMLLGAYFAFSSGALDAVVYDTVLEETGSSEGFQRELGRLKAIESAAFVASALLGGWWAESAGTRAMFLWSVPFMVASAVTYLAFREPSLHRREEPVSVRTHVADTVAALRRSPDALPVVVLGVLTACGITLMIEFGPLWLVTLGVSAVWFGPHLAALTSALGLGGLYAGRVDLTRRTPLAATTVALLAAALTLALDAPAPVVILAQGTVALVMVATGIHAAAMLHDALPSEVRASAASGVSAVSWLVFLPVALGCGALVDAAGVQAAGSLVSAVAVAVILTLWKTRRPPSARTSPALPGGRHVDQ